MTAGGLSVSEQSSSSETMITARRALGRRRPAFDPSAILSVTASRAARKPCSLLEPFVPTFTFALKSSTRLGDVAGRILWPAAPTSAPAAYGVPAAGPVAYFVSTVKGPLEPLW